VISWQPTFPRLRRFGCGGDRVTSLSRNRTSSDLSAIRAALSEQESYIRDSHFSGAGGSVIVQRRTSLIDRTLTEICHLHASTPKLPTLVAIGGYGRGELNPHSDIDIMLLCRDERQRERASPLLYSFWDAGLDIGYSVRTAAECIDLARSDAKIRTSLLESRFITGDPDLYRSYWTRMHAEVFQRKTAQYITEKISERLSTRRKYGGSLYLREPNIKESSGGLRDFHIARWIAMSRFRVSTFEELLPEGIIAPAELVVYHRARNFLWLVRNELHYVSGRKNDQLTYDLQDIAARDFHYRDSAHLMAVERFMKTYFLHARTVQQFSRLITDRCLPQPRRPWFGRPSPLGAFMVMGKTLIPSPGVSFEERPHLLMEALETCHSRNLQLSEHIKRLIAAFRFDDGARRSPEMSRSFLSILDRPEGLSGTLTLMRDLKVLGRYLPEFRAIQGLARHDYFHLYTVDEHILTAIRSLEGLQQGRVPALESLSRAFRSLRHRWVLMLAVLLHDLGKSYRTGHEQRGREIVGQVLDRLGMTGDERERVLFLVGNHLLMSDLSQRRELGDRNVIAEFAGTVRDPENLALLYLLTYADMAAVSPAAWTPWKATLLQDLYLRTLEFFEQPEGRAEEETQRLMAVAERLRKDARNRFPEDEISSFLAAMPRHYLLKTAPARLLEHLDWVRRLPAEQLVIRHRDLPDRGCTELSVCAYDAYGMFYRTAGTIAAQDLNIIRAKVYTARNGIMIDTFEVTGADGSMVPHAEVWETVKSELRTVLLTGRRPPEARISAYERKLPGSVPVTVSFDNETSDSLTIIDITARDRVGLLYRITKTLYDLNLDIASAKITTEGIRVLDAFYVSDLFGAKITDQERLAKIRDALSRTLADERAGAP
jgi:[protein-PII] uridylyltransferase